jgi:hypothetical protein
MRRRDIVLASLSTLPLTAASGLAGQGSKTQGSKTGPVVLELFTSQGCSSCPPADALLGELTRQPGIIGLAWHVDYWNSLGWRDPYARREWTERQKTYAQHLRSEVFTPALVVNGAAMLVGSDRAAVRRAIDTVSPPPVVVALRRAGSGLEAEITPVSNAMTGMLVTYDPEQSTQVETGENQGRRLVEYRVVRDVATFERLTPMPVLPSVPANRGAVLLVQDAEWRVIGVADLPPASMG